MTGFARLPWNSRRFTAAFILVAVAYAAILVAQARNRKPWNDEAMSASAGYTLATLGHLGIPAFDDHDPAMRDIHQRLYYILPLQPVVLAAWYKVVGFSLFKTRILSMLWTALLFFSLYRFIKLLSGDARVALLAVALTAFDYQIISAAAFGRYDTMVAALGFSAYNVFLSLRTGRFTIALVASNFLVVAAGLTHPNGVLYFLGLWFLILYHDRDRISFKNVAVAATPYLIGGAALGWYILQDIPAFESQLLGNTGHRVGLFHPWQNLENELLLRWIRPYGLGLHAPGQVTEFIRIKAIALLGYLAGVVGCVSTSSIRRQPGYRVLLLLTAIHFLYITFFEGMKFNYYLVHLLPFYLSLLAVFLYHSWNVRPVFRVPVVASVALLSAVAVGGILMRVRVDDMHRSYQPAVDYLIQNGSSNDLVFASCSFGFGYGFGPNLVDDGTFGFYSGWKPRFVVMEEIYEDNLQLFQGQAAKYQHIVEFMASYRMRYDNAGYKVYERISAGTPATVRNGP